MNEFQGRHTLLLSLITLAVVALSAPKQASSQPATDDAEAVIEATFVNNHREAIEVLVWVDGWLHKLGALPPGDRGTFALPAAVKDGARYYLLSTCMDRERITSEPLVAIPARHPIFVVGRTARQSYVRYERGTRAAEQP